MSRTSMGALTAEIVDTSAMLKEEKKLFDYLVENLNNIRKNVLYNILEAKIPDVEKKEAETKEEVNETENKEVREENKEKAGPEPEKEVSEENKSQKIRFLDAVPKFIGKDLEEYGPFEKEDVANLPSEIADVLINKERAEIKKE